mmetsp:Transcript_1757/g.6424  ORF Transcript_1757/g.6424 Transcript_1757/m.6424 type:complete len:297 (-) Transcript_1757:382-1272(-)
MNNVDFYNVRQMCVVRVVHVGKRLILQVNLTVGFAMRRRIDVFLLVDTVATVFIARVVDVRPGAWRRPSDFVFDTERVHTTNDAEESHLAPILAPRVTHDPILRPVVRRAPADDGDDVIDFKVGRVSVNATDVRTQAVGINTSGYGATSVNFSHDGVFTRNHAVFCHSGVRKRAQCAAESAVFGKSAARTARIHRRARVISTLCAVALGGFRTARLIRQARVKRYEPCVVHELIRPGVGSAVARPRDFGTAIQNVLNSQVHVLSAMLPAGDLNSVRQRAHRSMRPARPAVLRNVLI